MSLIIGNVHYNIGPVPTGRLTVVGLGKTSLTDMVTGETTNRWNVQFADGSSYDLPPNPAIDGLLDSLIGRIPDKGITVNVTNNDGIITISR